MYKKLITKRIIAIIIFLMAATAILFWIGSQDGVLQGTDDMRSFAAFLRYASVLLLLWYLAFWHFIKIKIKPTPQSATFSKENLIVKIKAYFAQAKEEGVDVFVIKGVPNGLEISWNRTIDFKQILAYGSKTVNFITTIYFLEGRHICDIHSKIERINRSVGITGVSYSYTMNSGIVYENSANYVPSFEMVNGNIVMDMKKLKYNNATIIDPIIEICKTSGWISRFQTLKHRWAKIVFKIVGILLLCLAFGLLGLSFLAS